MTQATHALPPEPERLSALMDGEADAAALDHACAGWPDVAVARDWHAWHLIGDVLRSEESYSQKWVYVAENPVRKSLATRPEDWPYQGEIYPLEGRRHVG